MASASTAKTAQAADRSLASQPATFVGPLTISYIDGSNWRLAAPFAFHRPELTITIPAVEVAVPAGFETDFASVPRFFWRLFPPAGSGVGAAYGRAAVIHDYLYRTPGACVSRRAADRIFREAMEAEGVAGWRRWTLWLAVRVFGGRSWRGRP